MSDRRSGTGEGRRQRGVVLLAVLWLSLALTMIALTTSYLVRTQAESVSSRMESSQAYYMARGAIEATMESIGQAASRPGNRMGSRPGGPADGGYRPGIRWLRQPFAHGDAVVEIVPESGKLNVNLASEQQLGALFQRLGLEAEESAELAAAIVDWRSPRESSIESTYDLYYAQLAPPYQAPHAPITDLDDLLAVRGMTRDFYFGRPVRNEQGGLTPRPALAELLTTDAAPRGINVNYAALEVLLVLPGWDAALAEAVIASREIRPFDSLEDLHARIPALATVTSVSPVSIADGPVYTLTATGRLRGSRVRRTVRARVSQQPGQVTGFQVLGWWDDWPWAGQGPDEMNVELQGGRG